MLHPSFDMTHPAVSVYRAQVQLQTLYEEGQEVAWSLNGITHLIEDVTLLEYGLPVTLSSSDEAVARQFPYPDEVSVQVQMIPPVEIPHVRAARQEQRAPEGIQHTIHQFSALSPEYMSVLTAIFQRFDRWTSLSILNERDA